MFNKLKDTMQYFHSHKGFTLVELVVVMAILSILAGVVTVYCFNAVSKADKRVNEANIMILQRSVDVYKTSNEGQLPSTLEQLEESSNGGPYLKEVPDPPGNYTSYQLKEGVVVNS